MCFQPFNTGIIVGEHLFKILFCELGLFSIHRLITSYTINIAQIEGDVKGYI